jgi:hypothetical protein
LPLNNTACCGLAPCEHAGRAPAKPDRGSYLLKGGPAAESATSGRDDWPARACPYFPTLNYPYFFRKHSDRISDTNMDSHKSSEIAETRGQPPPLPNVLSRRQLTLALVLVTLIPFVLVVFLYTTLPVGADPVLQADVDVTPRAWPNDEAPNARLVPSVVLRNPTSEDWGNVNMSINEQFHFYHPETLAAGGEIFVPLKFFHTKGNAFFPPESQQLRLLTVYAQIPSGRRAILEVKPHEFPYRASAGKEHVGSEEAGQSHRSDQGAREQPGG